MSAPGPSHGLPLEGRSVLVIDDQPSIRGVLQVALEQAGARVHGAADGRAGVAAALDLRPDVILLDLGMPEMDGWAVLDALSRSDAARIPVVLQTSMEDLASFDRAKRLGVAAFVSKPFRLAEIVETCRRVVRGARPLLGLESAEPQHRRVEVDTREGKSPFDGALIDFGPRGAQVELDRRLPVGSRVTLTFGVGPDEQRTGEVRWVTGTAGLYCHGLVFDR